MPAWTAWVPPAAVVASLVLVPACTVKLELAEHRFPKGDLAAVSAGLQAPDRWLAAMPPDAPPLTRTVVAAGPRPRQPAFPADDHTATPAPPLMVTLAPELALADRDFGFVVASPARAAGVAPALGPDAEAPSSGRLALDRPAAPAGLDAPWPSPPKPGVRAAPTWIPEPKPLAALDVRRRAPDAPLPPPARPVRLASLTGAAGGIANGRDPASAPGLDGPITVRVATAAQRLEAAARRALLDGASTTTLALFDGTLAAPATRPRF